MRFSTCKGVQMTRTKLPRKMKRSSLAALTDEQKAKRRKAQNAVYKRREREANKAKVAAKTKLDNERCCNVDYLQSFTVLDPSRPGCWVWTGKFMPSWYRAIPRVTAGQYGRMSAARAMWIALDRKGMFGKNVPKTSCGHDDCIAPDHLYLSNPSMERARAALRKR